MYPIPGWGGTPSWTGVPPPGRDVGPFIGVFPVPGRDLGLVTGVPPSKGTWDQSLGYHPERTWDQWKYYGIEMG